MSVGSSGVGRTHSTDVPDVPLRHPVASQMNSLPEISAQETLKLANKEIQRQVYDRTRAAKKRKQATDDLASLKKQIKFMKTHSDLSLEFATQGFAFTPEIKDKSLVDSFKQVVLNECVEPNSESRITGDYIMTGVNSEKLMNNDVVKDFLAPILTSAKDIFTKYLGHEVEIKISSSAILDTPPTDYCSRSQSQVMHADNLGFAAISVIIMLSETGGDSTYVIDKRHYGPDPIDERNSLLEFKMDDLNNPLPGQDLDAISSAIRERYGSLLELSPALFFNLANTSRMSYGQAQLFRTDGLHAGPYSATHREVMFLELRVVGEGIPLDPDHQYRFPQLLEIAGVPKKKWTELKKVWKTRGYTFPEDIPRGRKK